MKNKLKTKQIINISNPDGRLVTCGQFCSNVSNGLKVSQTLLKSVIGQCGGDSDWITKPDVCLHRIRFISRTSSIQTEIYDGRREIRQQHCRYLPNCPNLKSPIPECVTFRNFKQLKEPKSTKSLLLNVYLIQNCIVCKVF